jgi:hypothetical protein
MSIYKGQWPEKGAATEATIQVTVDGQPLPPAEAEVPAVGRAFGWGTFSARANKKLLAYSMLLYEMHHNMGLPLATVHRHLLDIGDAFMDERITSLDKQWSMTSEDIAQWIKERYPKTWAELSSHHAPA